MSYASNPSKSKKYLQTISKKRMHACMRWRAYHLVGLFLIAKDFWTFCFEDRNLIFFGHHQGRLAIHSGCVQVLWDNRSIKVLPVYCNVEWSGLVGVELFNFSEVHVDIIFGSCILCLPSDDQGRPVISWCGSSTHDNRWWLVIITTLGVDTKGGIYVVIVVIGPPNAIINIVSIPR